jgi:hypothetical protein
MWMDKRSYNIYNPESGLACAIMGALFGVTLLGACLVSSARGKYADALLGPALGVAYSAVWLLFWRWALSDSICISQTQLEKKVKLCPAVAIRWEDVRSVTPRQERGSFWRRSIRVTTWVVRDSRGQTITIPGFAATADEIVQELRRRLPESVWRHAVYDIWWLSAT